eukprot:3940895-Rhodomonas_salina.10
MPQALAWTGDCSLRSAQMGARSEEAGGGILVMVWVTESPTDSQAQPQAGARDLVERWMQ